MRGTFLTSRRGRWDLPIEFIGDHPERFQGFASGAVAGGDGAVHRGVVAFGLGRFTGKKERLLDRVRQALNNRAHEPGRRTPSDYGAAEA